MFMQLAPGENIAKFEINNLLILKKQIKINTKSIMYLNPTVEKEDN